MKVKDSREPIFRISAKGLSLCTIPVHNNTTVKKIGKKNLYWIILELIVFRLVIRSKAVRGNSFKMIVEKIVQILRIGPSSHLILWTPN